MPITFYILAVAFSVCLVYAAIELGRLAARFVEDNPDSESAPPAPLVSYGACCLPEGCKDYLNVDLDLAKADCEMQGGTFKAFYKCLDGICPEEPKAEVRKPVRKTRQKSPPSSSMKVSRKGVKKTQRKKRDR